jgi:hypothetical protein
MQAAPPVPDLTTSSTGSVTLAAAHDTSDWSRAGRVRLQSGDRILPRGSGVVADLGEEVSGAIPGFLAHRFGFRFFQKKITLFTRAIKTFHIPI